jgi:hypothetical protein
MTALLFAVAAKGSLVGLIATAIGTVIGSVLIACFIVGLAVRATDGLRAALTGTSGRSEKRDRRVGRDLSDETPVRKRRTRGGDDPTLPIGRDRR